VLGFQDHAEESHRRFLTVVEKTPGQKVTGRHSGQALERHYRNAPERFPKQLGAAALAQPRPK
jgi:hypothetical protein